MMKFRNITTYEEYVIHGGKFLFRFSENNSLTMDMATKSIKKMCKNICLPEDLSLISFRKGGHDLKDDKLPGPRVQVLGIWRSDAYKRYVTTTPYILILIHSSMYDISNHAID